MTRYLVYFMFIIYDFIFLTFAIIYFPYLIIRGKWHPGFKMRFGNLGVALDGEWKVGGRIWIHAVSVGEVMAITGLVKKLKEKFPSYAIVCSTVTKTGSQLAKEQLEKDCLVIYAPFDFSWIVRKFIRTIKPKIYISTETEIWPNLYSALHKNGIPIIQINGRISDRAFRGYSRVRFLTKRILACVNIFCMQSRLDADRIQRLGAALEKVRVVGNLKFDILPETTEIKKTDLGFREDQTLLIAGSTHAGEEDIILWAYQTLVKEFPRLRLAIAPRHVERTESVIKIIEGFGYRAVKFSEAQKGIGDSRSVMVVDTIGHLRSLYSLAAIVFIGKSFAVGGGQNMIESAWAGKPTIVGPLTQNFKDAVDIFVRSDALIQVADAEELLTEMRNLLKDSNRAREIGKVAKQTVSQYQGATIKTVHAIEEILNRHKS